MLSDSDNSPIKKKRVKPTLLATSSSSSDESDVPVRKRKHQPRISSSSDSDDSIIIKHTQKRRRALPDSEPSTDSTDSEVDQAFRPMISKNRRSKQRALQSDSDSAEDSAKRNSGKASDSGSHTSDDESEKCIICFKTFRDAFARPSGCQHKFHSECLLTWSKTSNTCPIDRVKYTEVIVNSIDGDIIGRHEVSTPTPVALGNDIEPDDPTFCEVCHQHDREHEMLLCDRCEAGYHLDCLTPPLTEIPLGDWYCPDCDGFNNDEIDHDEVNDLLRDGILLDTRMRRRPPPTPRIGPRTRAVQRVISSIRQMAEESILHQPSSSRSRASTSCRTHRRRSHHVRRSAQYKVELVTVEDGSTIEVKIAVNTRKKRSKKRRKSNAASCSRGRRSSSKRASMKSGGCDSQRPSASENPFQRLDIFGSRPQLEYFSGGEAEDELEEDGGLSTLRARTAGGVRGMANRKQIAAEILRSAPRRPSPRIAYSSAPPDLVSSILNEQTKWHSPNAVIQSNSNGEVKITLPNKSSSLPVKKCAGNGSGPAGGSGTGEGTSGSSSKETAACSSRGEGEGSSSVPPLQPPPQPVFSRVYEDEDFDLYADIEPPLAPPPEPPALLLALDGDEAVSSPEDAQLVIDDRQTYDPDVPTSPPPTPPENLETEKDEDESKKKPKNTLVLSPAPVDLSTIRLPSPEPDIDDCPNRFIYSAASVNIARQAQSDSESDKEIDICKPPALISRGSLESLGKSSSTGTVLPIKKSIIKEKLRNLMISENVNMQKAYLSPNSNEKEEILKKSDNKSEKYDPSAISDDEDDEKEKDLPASVVSETENTSTINKTPEDREIIPDESVIKENIELKEKIAEAEHPDNIHSKEKTALKENIEKCENNQIEQNKTREDNDECKDDTKYKINESEVNSGKIKEEKNKIKEEENEDEEFKPKNEENNDKGSERNNELKIKDEEHNNNTNSEEQMIKDEKLKTEDNENIMDVESTVKHEESEINEIEMKPGTNEDNTTKEEKDEHRLDRKDELVDDLDEKDNSIEDKIKTMEDEEEGSGFTDELENLQSGFADSQKARSDTSSPILSDAKEQNIDSQDEKDKNEMLNDLSELRINSESEGDGKHKGKDFCSSPESTPPRKRRGARGDKDDQEGEDVLELGCGDERDGLVDITDEEISTYEKSWELEDKEGPLKKSGGLEGLETEAISDCEYNLGDVSQSNQKAMSIENGPKEEGEIGNDEKKVPVSWKKATKAKERSYREKDSTKEKTKKKEKKPKEKRKELERYDVRKIISDKPKKRRVDEFGRDISPSRSRSLSDSRSRSRSRSRSIRSIRSIRSRRSRSRSKSKKRRSRDRRSRNKSRGRSRSIGRGRVRSRDRSRKRRSKSRSKSGSKRRKSRTPQKNKERRSRAKSREKKRRQRESSMSCSSCSCSSCERERRKTKKLTVIVPNKPTGSGKEKKKSKYKDRSETKRRRVDSPVPSKEVFTSGDNILVSVNFKSSKSGEGGRKESSKKKKDDEPKKKKDKGSKENQPLRSIVSKTSSNQTEGRRRKINSKNLKPVAIIDLAQSPFREQTLSPKEVIVLTDSDSEKEVRKNNENNLPPCQGTGPKTPPEPHIKFNIINSKPQMLRSLANPLLDSVDQLEGEAEEDERIDMAPHKGPNTPPEPPVPYDPFEPTKSRSPTPLQELEEIRKPPTPTGDKILPPEPIQRPTTPPKPPPEPPKTPSPLHSPPPKPPLEDNPTEKAHISPPNNCNDDSMDMGGGDSPYSPGSSDGEDIFEPPLPQLTTPAPITKAKTRNQKLIQKLTPSPLKRKPGAKTSTPLKNSKGKKESVGMKLDEDQLKILDDLPNSAVEMQVKDKFLKKLNRQERVVEEVKMVLKPHYAKKHVNKEEYKEILRKSVPKICHSRSGEINPIKIQRLIEAYVKKYRHLRKKRKIGTFSAPDPMSLLKPKPKATMWC